MQGLVRINLKVIFCLQLTLLSLKKPSRHNREGFVLDMFGEAKLIMKHLQTRDHKDENVPVSSSL
jgi:hypothetical protein